MLCGVQRSADRIACIAPVMHLSIPEADAIMKMDEACDQYFVKPCMANQHWHSCFRLVTMPKSMHCILQKAHLALPCLIDVECPLWR